MGTRFCTNGYRMRNLHSSRGAECGPADRSGGVFEDCRNIAGYSGGGNRLSDRSFSRWVVCPNISCHIISGTSLV